MDYAGIDLLRRIAIEWASIADTGYDDDAYMAALNRYGPDSDEQSLLHPANFITEQQLEDADDYVDGLRQGLGLVRVRRLGR